MMSLREQHVQLHINFLTQIQIKVPGKCKEKASLFYVPCYVIKAAALHD